MNSCTIPARDLLKIAQDIVSDGMDYVEVTILEEDLSDPDMPIPPSVHFSCFKKSDPYAMVDYEDIDSVDPLP